MKALSEENLQRLTEELQLVNLSIKYVDETAARLASEYGYANVVAIRSDLYKEKHLLEVKTSALADFLRG